MIFLKFSRLLVYGSAFIFLTCSSTVSAIGTVYNSLQIEDSTFASLFNENTDNSWEFSPNIVDYDIETWSAKLRIGGEVKSRISRPESGGGVLISNGEDHARSDLILRHIKLKPFTWYRILMDVTIISGSPTPTAGLSPEGFIRRIDIDHFRYDSDFDAWSALIHTGKDTISYDLKVSLVGKGEAEFDEIIIQEGPEYIKPGGKVLVLDLLSLERSDQNLDLWENIKNLVYVFGFDTIQIVHPLNARKKKIHQIKPDLLILSPTAIAVDQKMPGFLWKKRFKKGVKNFVEYAKQNEIPLFGICAGHQELASTFGAYLARVKDDTTGKYIYEIGPTELHAKKHDTIFKGLPNYHEFTVMQAHTIVVHSEFKSAANLASSEFCPTQIFKYTFQKKDGSDLYWYSFQGHIEKDWYRSSPDGARIFKNMLEQWEFIKGPEGVDKQ